MSYKMMGRYVRILADVAESVAELGKDCEDASAPSASDLPERSEEAPMEAFGLSHDELLAHADSCGLPRASADPCRP